MFKTSILAAATALLLSSLPAFAADPHKTRAIGDSNLIAPVPAPGYPEAMIVHGDKFYVSGPAAFGVGFAAVFVYDLESGRLLNTISITGEPYPGGASCLTFDDEGNLYVLVEALGVVKIDHRTQQQSVYSPTLPVLFASSNPPAPFLANDLAFDKRGNLYITDSFQASIWKVAKGGGPARLWLHDARLNGLFGPNGLRIDRAHDMLYFDQTVDSSYVGYLYRVPLKDNPVFADLQLLHVWAPNQYGFAGPDGLELSASGKIYVALAGASQISVIDPSNPNIAANEVARFSGPAKTSDPAHPLPWTNPANIAFDNENRRILVTNHASLINPINPALFAVFDVYVDDRGIEQDN